MKILQTYLGKHTAIDALILSEPVKELKFVVVIPAYIETRLEECLVSLFNTSRPISAVEIIVVINWPEDASDDNIRISRESYSSLKLWIEGHTSGQFKIHALEMGFIPQKKAGVGYARKIGMDEAIRRFLAAGQHDGIIISYDADTNCDPDYFTSIEKHFRDFPTTDGCSIFFEHPLEGDKFPAAVYGAITQYELHMRYYLNAVRYTGFPNAFYTVGSAFAVRATSYCKQGGMNIRQAGEDFYFLQKFFDLGHFSDLLTTRVCPSPRPSLRVPFGTGKAITQLINGIKPQSKTLDSFIPMQSIGESNHCLRVYRSEREGGLNDRVMLKSYHPATFDMLKDFFESVPGFYEQLSFSGKVDLSGLYPCLIQFLEESGFNDELTDIYENSGDLSAFTKRFYRYFNMFRILKFSKHVGKAYPALPVKECALLFLQKIGLEINPDTGEKEILKIFREKDRGFNGLR